MTLLTAFAPSTRLGDVSPGIVVPVRHGRPRLPLLAADLMVAGLLLVTGALLADAPGLIPTLVAVLTWGAALLVCGAHQRAGRRIAVRGALRAAGLLAAVSWVAATTILPAAASAAYAAIVATLVLAGVVSRLLLARSAATGVVVAGDVADVQVLLSELRRTPDQPWQVAAVCVDADDPTPVDSTMRDLPIRIGVDDVVTVARATGAASVVVLPGRAFDPAAVRRAGWAAHAAGLEVFVGTGLLDVEPERVRHTTVGHVGLARVEPRTTSSVGRAAKHLLDRLLAGLALLALLPLLAAITIAVRWDSPGGALYTQRRTGRDGSTFTMYKFRTMRTDADAARTTLANQNDCDGVLFKMREDPRVTRTGRLLRRYSLDELPQLVNVLRGDMSLVGPRPALPSEVARYDQDPLHRLAVRPGLTGLWQVSGRSDLTWEESVRLDLHYVDNWSWGLDLRILARTVGAVLSHRGAY